MIVPSVATPVAIPTWRSVELIPEAIPARAGSTTPTAVEMRGVDTRPVPMPPTTIPARRCVQSDSGVSPRMSRSPAPVSRKPAPISARRGTCEVRRPAMPAVMKIATVSGRNRMPVSTAERPRLFCM